MRLSGSMTFDNPDAGENDDPFIEVDFEAVLVEEPDVNYYGVEEVETTPAGFEGQVEAKLMDDPGARDKYGDDGSDD